MEYLKQIIMKNNDIIETFEEIIYGEYGITVYNPYRDETIFSIHIPYSSYNKIITLEIGD